MRRAGSPCSRAESGSEEVGLDRHGVRVAPDPKAGARSVESSSSQPPETPATVRSTDLKGGTRWLAYRSSRPNRAAEGTFRGSYSRRDDRPGGVRMVGKSIRSRPPGPRNIRRPRAPLGAPHRQDEGKGAQSDEGRTGALAVAASLLVLVLIAQPAAASVISVSGSQAFASPGYSVGAACIAADPVPGEAPSVLTMSGSLVRMLVLGRSR